MKDKKLDGDKDKKKKEEDTKFFGQKINKNQPGPGTYDIKRELNAQQTKFTSGGRFNIGTGAIRRDIVIGMMGL